MLFLSDLGTPASAGFTEVETAVFAGLQKSPYKLEFYEEALEVTLFPDEVSQRRFREGFIGKYSERKPDLIIAAGSASLKFIAESHESFIRDTPIIFCGVLGEVPDRLNSHIHFTGVLGKLHPAETLSAALHLFPGTEHVVVVGGLGKFDEEWERVAKRAFQNYESKLEFRYLTDLAMPVLLERLRQLPSNTIVYHTAFTQDVTGARFIDSAQAVPLVTGAANAPIFVMDDVDLRAGTVGGDLVNWGNDGHVAADMAVRVLNGEKPEDIPVVMSNHAYMFDWRALKRWGLKVSDLPPGSIVLNREPSIWEIYTRYIVAGALLLIVQALIIFALLWQRSKRRKVEKDLVRTNDRLRLAMESGKSVGWEFELASGHNRWFGDLQTIFGIPSNLFTGVVGDFYHSVHPEDRDRVSRAVAKARKDREPYNEEFRVVRSDGTARWVVSRGEFEYAPNGEARMMRGMAVDITERKRTEEALKQAEEAERISENRFRQFFDTLPEYCFMTSANGEILDANPAACEALGYARNELVGKSLSTIYSLGSLSRLVHLLDNWQTTGTLHDEEMTIINREGQKRTLLLNAGSVKDTDGNLLYSTTVLVDVTERQQAEAALRESEERFRHVANTAPVMIWMSGPDELCTYFNQSWLNFTGRSLHADLGDGWLEGVHPDDLEGCLKTYRSSFDRREPFEMEFRLRQYDGEYRWIFDRGVPRFNQDGSFAGYIGSCIDVTDRKLAQESLSGMSRKLIEAQEQERMWIARELHDDINQQISLVLVNLERLQRDFPPLAPAIAQRLTEIQEHLSSLGSDIQALSHHLHSSKLEYLGLVTAAVSFCKELSQEHGVQVEFHSESVPKQLPREIALCFFRVLQESLQNALKHSGSKHFEVWLKATPNEIELTVRDSGVGFDPEEAIRRRGLGLTSMKERLKLVHGKLSVDSHLAQGTVIRATVPLNFGAMAASAGT